jgi:hypothetical protein
MDDLRQVERLAKREAFVGATNEEIAPDDQFAGDSSVLVIACECGRSGCAEVISLPRSVYEQARSEPRRFLLVPGHERPEIERALSRYDRFVVVAKEKQAATAIAEESDPRA